MAGEDFLCCVCLLPFHRPITLRCAHSFCRHCIMKALKSSPHCPLCRSPHSYEDLFEYSENKLLKKLTSAFKNETPSLNDEVSLKNGRANLRRRAWYGKRKKKNRKGTRTEEKGIAIWLLEGNFSFISLRSAFFFCSWPFGACFQSFLVLRMPDMVSGEGMKGLKRNMVALNRQWG